MKWLQKLSAVLVLGTCLAGTRVTAADTNYWIGASGADITNASSWSLNHVPTTAEYAAFTNSTAYSVVLGGSVTNGGALFFNTGPTIDLQGQIWNNGTLGYGTPGIYHSNSAPGLVLTFSSSTAPAVSGGNQAIFGSDAYGSDYIGVGSLGDVVVDDSLGYGVKVRVGAFGRQSGGTLLVSGADSEFYIHQPNGWGTAGSILVTNNAILRADYLTLGVGGAGTATVTGARLITGGATVGGYIGQGNLHLLNGSTWTANGAVQVAIDGYALGPYRGTILMDASTATVQSVIIGGCDGNPLAPGRVFVQNGSSLVISNFLRVSEVYAGQNTALDYGNHKATNHLVLANGTIYLGGGSQNGSITNYGLMRMAGTVTGQGAAPFTFFNGSWAGPTVPVPGYSVTNAAVLEIGQSIGQLTLNNGNLVMAPGSTLLLEFSETSLDQIVLNGGSASILGSNLYTIVGNTPTPGVKWGLGAYDFVVGENVTWNPQYDDITNVLAGYGLVQGLDYNYGVINLSGGLQALRLEFVPEPSTALLLLGGGLMLWRARRRRLAAP